MRYILLERANSQSPPQEMCFSLTGFIFTFWWATETLEQRNLDEARQTIESASYWASWRRIFSLKFSSQLSLPLGRGKKLTYHVFLHLSND